MNAITYATQGSGGFDFKSREQAVIAPGEYATISTGVHVADVLGETTAPLKGARVPVILVKGRSGLAFKHKVLAFEGTVDMDYPGEIKILLKNDGEEDFIINSGDRIAQGLVVMATRPAHIPYLQVARGGGFGSTGV